MLYGGVGGISWQCSEMISAMINFPTDDINQLFCPSLKLVSGRFQNVVNSYTFIWACYRLLQWNNPAMVLSEPWVGITLIWEISRYYLKSRSLSSINLPTACLISAAKVLYTTIQVRNLFLIAWFILIQYTLVVLVGIITKSSEGHILVLKPLHKILF